MSERAYKAALERIVQVGGYQWPGATDIAKRALDEGFDFTEDNVELFAWLEEQRAHPTKVAI